MFNTLPALRSLLPAFLYALGMLSFFFSDLIVSSSYSPEVVSDWANLKSFMMMLSPLLLLGLSNLYIRWPESAKGVSVTAFIVLLFSSGVLLLVSLVCPGLFPSWYVEICFAYCITVCGMSFLRGELRLVQAQLQQNFWKITLFFMASFYALNGGGGDIQIWFRVALWGSVVILFVPFVFGGKKQMAQKSFRLLSKGQYFFSVQMMLSTGTMAISAYVGVYLVSSYADSHVSASFFAHYVIFTGFAVVFSGYVGFVLTPLVKRKPEKYVPLLVSNKSIILGGAVGAFFINLFAGVLLFKGFYGEKYQINFVWCALLSFECVLRSVYVLPTAILGAYADGAKLTSFVVVGCVGCFVIVVASYFGVGNERFVDTLLLAILLNWMLRFVSALWVARNVINDKRLLQSVRG